MRHPFSYRMLGEILLDKQYVSHHQIDAVLVGKNGRLGEALLDEGRITPAQLAEALAEQCGLPYVDLEGFVISPELYSLISATHAYQYGVVPYQRDGEVLIVVVSPPCDITLADRLECLSGLKVRLFASSPQAIAAVLKRSEGNSEVLKGVSEDFKLAIVKENDDGKEQYVSLDAANDDAASPVIKLINSMLSAAIQKRVSDVHIETYEKGISINYRIDGVLYPATDTLDRRHQSALVSRLKVMAELDIAEKRVPQDGRFKLRFGSRDIDFRVSILPSVFGEDVVIRILDKSSITDGMKNLRLESLGMVPEILKKFRKSIHEPYGMVLITGPTGSGKTTTLYAALSELNTGDEKIITIEDPVEYQLHGIVQIAVNEKKNLTFAKGLRSILRHDPDKIMVGEIRDGETAQIAVQSALTGHLVFTTVHANSAFDVLGRFSHMGVDTYNFVSALNCVMAQRLVRIICPKCKRQTTVDDGILELSGLDPAQYQDQAWYEGAGCDYCHGTGYRGRAAVTEFLALSPSIRQMIIERRPINEMQAAAVQNGMVTLRQSALALVLSGQATLKEINRVTFVE